MKRSENIGELVAALAKAQSEFTAATKDSDNPYFSSKYADLASVIGAVRPALSKNGIAMMHELESDLERQVASVTVGLYHGEQFMEVTVEAPATGKGKNGELKFDVQSIGSAWTYLRRYTLQSICGLASEDDDGNSLQGNNAPIQKRTTPAQATAKKPEATPQAPEAPAGPFLLVGEDKLTCVITGVMEKETAGKKKYLNVVFNGRHMGFNYGTCFDTKLFEALKAGTNKEVQIKFEMAKENKFINITDVMYVDGVPYDLGKPSVDVETGEVIENPPTPSK